MRLRPAALSFRFLGCASLALFCAAQRSLWAAAIRARAATDKGRLVRFAGGGVVPVVLPILRRSSTIAWSMSANWCPYPINAASRIERSCVIGLSLSRRGQKVSQNSATAHERRHFRVFQCPARRQNRPLPGPPEPFGTERMKETAPTEEVAGNQGGQPYIEILPANPDVIYVPVYDPVWISKGRTLSEACCGSGMNMVPAVYVVAAAVIAAAVLSGVAFGQVKSDGPVKLTPCADAHRTGRRIVSNLDIVEFRVPRSAPVTKASGRGGTGLRWHPPRGRRNHSRQRRKRAFYEGRPRYTGLVKTIAAAVPPLENRFRRSAPKTQARSITNLVKITDDDADGIISTERLKKERRYSLDSVLRES